MSDKFIFSQTVEVAMFSTALFVTILNALEANGHSVTADVYEGLKECADQEGIGDLTRQLLLHIARSCDPDKPADPEKRSPSDVAHGLRLIIGGKDGGATPEDES